MHSRDQWSRRIDLNDRQYQRVFLPAATCGLAFVFACANAAAADPSPALARLAQYNLSPTTQSLAGYLASLQPTPERQKVLLSLVAQLGDDDYARREEATRELMRQIGGASPSLAAAVAGDNPEIRWRAKIVQDQTDRESRAVLSAVLSAIAEQKIPALAQPLFAVAPLASDQHLQGQLRRALAATAGQSDVEYLKKQLATGDARARVAALATLSAVIGERICTDALPMLTDASDEVRLMAAQVLAGHGRRDGLATLVKLLEAENTHTRGRAIQTLRAATGQHFGYTVYDPADKRAEAIGRWNQWLAAEGATAALILPLRETPLDLGRLLVCDHQQNALVEFDTAGTKVWEKTVGMQPWACVGLPNGHRLVGSYNEKSVVEYDAQGDEVWRVDSLPGGPTSIERLENGNTLIACTDGGQVVEMDQAKKIVWRASLEGRPVDARRLDDGRTLVALQNGQKVVELDEHGREVWQISGLGQPFSAQRLESGSTLVCSLGQNAKVREYDRAGRIVWEQGSFNNPYSAQRLASGNTLVVDLAGVHEMDRQGTVITKLQRQNLSRAWRY
jgi:HEAT repeat protein